MLRKEIIFFGQKAVIACDGKCNKAWGLNSRPKVEVSGGIFCMSDAELGEAPADPRTYEGGCAKPVLDEEKLNKWCARECERCGMSNPGSDKVELPNYSTRVRLY